MSRQIKPSASHRSRDNSAGHDVGPERLRAAAGLFAVLSEESRLRILHHLQTGPAGVGELVGTLGMKQANVSKQLGILHAAGVVGRRQDGNRAVYSIAMPMVFKLCDLVCRDASSRAASLAAALDDKNI